MGYYKERMSKYYKEKTYSVKVVFNNENDSDIIDYLKNHCKNKNGLVKELIRERMKKEGY